MPESPRPPHRVGVVGLGLMGRRMLGALAAHPGFVAACGFDPDPAALARAGAEHGLEACADLAALLARDDLALVYVATPPASHVGIAREVLARGRALLLEKPLAVDLAEAGALVDEAEAAGRVAALNFPFATLPGLGRVERELRDGSAGAPLRVEVELHFSRWPRTWHTAGPWLSQGAQGGFLREVFSHFAYLTQRLLGPARVLRSQVDRAPGRAEERVVAELACGPVPVALIGGAGGAAPDANRWTLYGEARSYRLEDWSRLSTSDGGPWRPLEPAPGESGGLADQLDELDALLRGAPSRLPGLRDGLDVMRAVEALLA